MSVHICNIVKFLFCISLHTISFFKTINIFILLYSLCPSHRILSVHALTSCLYQSEMGHTREELSIRECQMIADQSGYRLQSHSPPSGVVVVVCLWLIDFCHSIPTPAPNSCAYIFLNWFLFLVFTDFSVIAPATSQNIWLNLLCQNNPLIAL